jgi:hypothetical protein
VAQHDKIIIVEAYAPSNEGSITDYVPARIEWKLVENIIGIDTCGEAEIRHDIVRKF